MPSFQDSNWLAGQAKLNEDFNNAELRFNDPVVFKMFLENREIMFPTHDQLRLRNDRPISSYYLTCEGDDVTQAEIEALHTGSQGDSATMPITMLPYKRNWSHSIKQADNNIYSLQEMMNNDLRVSVKKFADTLNGVATQYLFDNLSGVNASDGTEGAFDVPTSTFRIPIANENRAIQITKGAMHINKYNAGLTYVCDTIAFNKFEFFANQGSANNENLSFQFQGNRFIHSTDLNALADAAGYSQGYWIALDSNTVAALDWIPKQNRENLSTRLQTYTNIINPVDGLQYAAHSYELAEDRQGALNGYNQDEVVQSELSINISLNNAPLTNAGETTILGYALV